MEQPRLQAELQERRQFVTVFIRDSLQPVKRLLEEGLLDDVDEDVTTEAQDFEVRDYQLDAWGALWDARQAGAISGLIHLATGLGKTSVGVFDVIKFRSEYQGRRTRGPRILFASHKNEINEQAAERFAAFIPDATQGTYSGAMKNASADITFATLQSLYGNLDSFKSNYFDYIIYDEAHHGKAETFEAVVRHFRPKFQLALTATPNRMDGLDIRELFGEELYSKGLAEALAEGLLADIDYHIVFDDAVKQAMQSDFEPATLKALKELFDVKPRNEIIADNIRKEKERIGLEGAKTIIFAENIEHAEEIAELLNGVPYHHKLSPKRRREIISNFRSGDVETISTRDMFNEGVDIPDARLIVFLRSTQSQTVFEQQLGRGLRKLEGKDRVSVLDFVANVERIAIVQELIKKVKEASGENSRKSRMPKSKQSTEYTGLIVQTAHGDFDFDRLAVDLLEKWAGIKELKESRWDSDDSIEIIRRALELSPGRALTYYAIVDLSLRGEFISATAIRQKFGGMPQFQEACGFKLPRNMTDDELVELANTIKPGEAFTSNDIKELSDRDEFLGLAGIQGRFGSLNEFNKARGIDMPDARFTTNEEIVAIALTISPDEPLSTAAIKELFKQGRFVGQSAILNKFGSLAAFHRACGFAIKDRVDIKSMSNEDIINLAKEIKPDGALSGKEIDELSTQRRFVSSPSIKTRFGSIAAFQEACGYTQQDKFSAESIIASARSLKPNGPLNSGEIVELSKEKKFVSLPMVLRQFGSLANFQKACGFDVIDVSTMTNEDIVTLAIKLHPQGPLKYDEIGQLSKEGKFVSSGVIAKRFGNMHAFHTACGFEPVRKTPTKVD